MITERRRQFDDAYSPERYARLLARLEERSGVPIPFAVAETPVLLERALLDQMANCGVEIVRELLNDPSYMTQARQAIPPAFRVAGETNRPHFVSADFGLVRQSDGGLGARLVDIHAFPSAYGFQALLSASYRDIYDLGGDLGYYLSGQDATSYWNALALTILGRQDPDNVVLTDVDAAHQKTRPDLEIMARKLGLAIVDIAAVEAEGSGLYYRNRQDRKVPIRRLYNRAAPEELCDSRLQVDFKRNWDVEWAGHPSWYFLIGRYSLPRLSRTLGMVQPTVFLDDFLAGEGAGVLGDSGAMFDAEGLVYSDLLLRPVLGVGKREQRRSPSRAELLAIPIERRREFVVQQRAELECLVGPLGPSHIEVRILYAWPQGGCLTPMIPMVRLRPAATDGVAEGSGAALSAAYFVR